MNFEMYAHPCDVAKMTRHWHQANQQDKSNKNKNRQGSPFQLSLQILCRIEEHEQVGSERYGSLHLKMPCRVT